MVNIRIILIILILLSSNCFAEIFSYETDSGIMHFTDNPSVDKIDKARLIKEAKNTFELKGELLFGDKEFRSRVEKASYSVFTISSGSDTGSGFFISSKGHIITNKHVIRGGNAFYSTLSRKYLNRKKEIYQEKASLEKRKNLNKKRLKALSLKISRPNINKEIENIKNSQKTILNNISICNKIIKVLNLRMESLKGSGREKRDSYTIVLKNGRKLSVKLLKESIRGDWALLKLDGYITPFLNAQRYVDIGEKVFAIGSPGGVMDFVSMGRVVDIDGTFIKTDAGVYPGSSGGPLVNRKGKIVGINTCRDGDGLKQKFGYAIPVKDIFMEYSQYFEGSL